MVYHSFIHSFNSFFCGATCRDFCMKPPTKKMCITHTHTWTHRSIDWSKKGKKDQSKNQIQFRGGFIKKNEKNWLIQNKKNRVIFCNWNEIEIKSFSIIIVELFFFLVSIASNIYQFEKVNRINSRHIPTTEVEVFYSFLPVCLFVHKVDRILIVQSITM